ncbi:LOW QUALITY PROTEIN: hypothetical protein HID58_058969 [Brassica napus]|uniref:Uncharacterized protein n=1 Tax=Brassica napus TaxID=3708 RepID=A0ABQ7ZRM8_BRANA|nr:LOW QUALITY PROTEIN: hypothetical protein HID58_058969 [Brassica napus]
MAQKIRRGGDLRVEAEEKRTNLRLREEQNAAYRASLEADQARESQRQEEEERLEREAAEAERKRKEEEEAQERAEREAVERETDRVRMRPEKVLAVGDDPEKVPDVAHFSSFSLPFITFSVLLLLGIYGTRGLFICRDNVGFGKVPKWRKKREEKCI